MADTKESVEKVIQMLVLLTISLKFYTMYEYLETSHQDYYRYIEQIL